MKVVFQEVYPERRQCATCATLSSPPNAAPAHKERAKGKIARGIGEAAGRGRHHDHGAADLGDRCLRAQDPLKPTAARKPSPTHVHCAKLNIGRHGRMIRPRT